MKTSLAIFFFLGLFLLSISFRFRNLSTPFWVDEFSTARNAQLVLKQGENVCTQQDEFFEHHNVTEHVIVAIFFKLFGVSESSARWPSVIFGSLVPVMLFVVAKKLFDTKTAVAATLLCIFSYFEITWSRQARSYALQQLLWLCAIWIYAGLIKYFSVKRFSLLIVFCVLGLLTHTTFLLLIFALFLHFIYLCFHWHFFNKETLKRFWPYVVCSLLLFLLLFFNHYFQAIMGGLKEAIQAHPNNVWYYHSFLWRQQTLVTFLAIIGVLLNILKYKKGTFLVVVPIVCYLTFICFLFPPYVSRYVLPIFPLMLIMAGFALSSIATAHSPRLSVLIVVLISLLIIMNGDKFVVKPKAFYSVDHDMREVALIDYDQVYALMKKKIGNDVSSVAIIDTWPDRARWYLGYDNQQIYYFHWQDAEGDVNGLSKVTQVAVNGQEKYLPGFNAPKIRFIGDVSDLQFVMSKYPKGFIWIDDSSLPADVIEYAKANFKQELYLDHYALDDNPYSIWPGTLYSWGFEVQK